MDTTPLPLTFRQLQYVVAVAELGSFRAAAQACHVSQPGLSEQVAEVERLLDVRLFERTTRRVMPTAAGEALVLRARRLLSDARELVDEMKRRSDPFAGVVTIGIIPTIAPYLLPRAAPAVTQELPRLTIRWEEDKTEALLTRLRDGALDAAVIARVGGLQEFRVVPVSHDAFLLAVPRGHALDRKGAASLADLRGQKVLLLDDGHCLRDQALSVCRAGRAEELGFRATGLSTLVQMVAAGAGITLLPALAAEVERQHAAIVLRPFEAPSPDRELVLVMRKGSALTAPLDVMAQALSLGTSTPASTTVGDGAGRAKGTKKAQKNPVAR